MHLILHHEIILIKLIDTGLDMNTVAGIDHFQGICKQGPVMNSVTSSEGLLISRGATETGVKPDHMQQCY